MTKSKTQSEGEVVLARVQRMSTGTLLEWLAGKKEGVLDIWVGKFELERRRQQSSEIRSWITVAISIVALVVSIVALVQKSSG